jgi:hypothetical protein
MFLKQVKEINNIQLESLLNALVQETNSLTESQIEDVVFIENTIKQDIKLKLSKEASNKYQEFIEKVVLFDDSLQEGAIQNFFLGKPNPNKDIFRYLSDKYKISQSITDNINISSVSKYISAIKTNSDKTDRNKDFSHLLKYVEDELKGRIEQEEEMKIEYKKHGGKYSEDELDDYAKPSIYKKYVQDIKAAMSK